MASEGSWIKRARYLTQALIISGTLNIGFLFTFLYFALQEKEPKVGEKIAKKKAKHSSLSASELLSRYESLPFEELLPLLNETMIVGHNVTGRDLALACLVAYHDFNIERALGGLSLQKRTFSYGEGGKTIDVFSGLADFQYQAIVHYAKTEKWPLTAKGLFAKMQQASPPYDTTQLEAFYLTPEFHYISTLFAKTGAPIRKDILASLLVEGKWTTIEFFSSHLSQSAEFTIENRRDLLLHLIDERSKLSARLFLKIDEEYAISRLDEDQTVNLLALLGTKTPESYVRALINSPRSEQVQKKCAHILYAQSGEQAPQNLEISQVKAQLTKAPATSKMHTVVTGDSLWKIARQYKTSVQAIKTKNSLKSDSLKPGQKLSIPE